MFPKVRVTVGVGSRAEHFWCSLGHRRSEGPPGRPGTEQELMRHICQHRQVLGFH